METNQKHAYLILAHNEFAILEHLLKALDHPQNDIYIHFDRKVDTLPLLKTEHSRLFILEDRIDVAWGDVSVVEAEYKLFEQSYALGPYAYYHLLSGVDLPLRSQDAIHKFCKDNEGKEFIGFSTYDYRLEVDRKVNYIHLFPRDFRKTGTLANNIKAILRAGYLRVQMGLSKKRYPNKVFKKGTQWVSITHGLVTELLTKKSEVILTYQNTFCADEIYKHTICWNSKFRDNIFDLQNEGRSSIRMIGWENGQLRDWEDNDYLKVSSSNMLFARKFNSKNKGIVNSIVNNIK